MGAPCPACRDQPSIMSAPNPTPAASKKQKKKKTPKSGGSNVFDQFSQRQVAEFKEGFQYMDRDKDGIIGRGDIRATADDVGVALTDPQIDQMVADCPADINFTQLINMFGLRQQGGASDEDEVVIAALGWIAWMYFGEGDAVKLCFTFGNFKVTLVRICFSVGGTNWTIFICAGRSAFFARPPMFHGEGDAVKLCFTFGDFKETRVRICFSVGGTNWTMLICAGRSAFSKWFRLCPKWRQCI